MVYALGAFLFLSFMIDQWKFVDGVDIGGPFGGLTFQGLALSRDGIFLFVVMLISSLIPGVVASYLARSKKLLVGAIPGIFIGGIPCLLWVFTPHLATSSHTFTVVAFVGSSLGPFVGALLYLWVFIRSGRSYVEPAHAPDASRR